MKNKFLYVISVMCLSSVLVSGCGNSGSAGGSISKYISSIFGETIDAGEVSALCPNGWESIGMSYTSPDGTTQTSANELRFVKGGSTQSDLLTNAYIDIKYYGAGSEVMSVDPKEWYDDVEELESFTEGDYTWEGYSAESLGVPFVYVKTKAEKCTVEVYLYTCEHAENSASITDADVLAILGSISFS